MVRGVGRTTLETSKGRRGSTPRGPHNICGTCNAVEYCFVPKSTRRNVVDCELPHRQIEKSR
jgi:hypothetical protein